MLKNSYAKKLYQFSRQQKNKQSASTKDLNDSLDLISPEPLLSKHHHRTQSCPSVETQQPLPPPPEQQTTRDHNNSHKHTKHKPTHRSCRSQAELDGLSINQSVSQSVSISINQNSLSIDKLSSVLYRRHSKESVLKKSRLSGGNKFRGLGLERGQYERVKIDQQMQKYELNESLA